MYEIDQRTVVTLLTTSVLTTPYKSPPLPVRGVVGIDIDRCIMGVTGTQLELPKIALIIICISLKFFHTSASPHIPGVWYVGLDIDGYIIAM